MIRSDGSYQFRGWIAPSAVVETLRSYVRDQRPPGHFLRSCIENDLITAMAHPDTHWFLSCLPAIAAFIAHEMPRACWGSPANVEAHLRGCTPADPCGACDDCRPCEICGKITPASLDERGVCADCEFTEAMHYAGSDEPR